jgi:cell division protein DivIC
LTNPPHDFGGYSFSETAGAFAVFNNSVDPCSSVSIRGFNFSTNSSFVAARRLIKLRAMNVDIGIWKPLTRAVAFLLLIAVVLLIAVWYLPLIRHNERMRKEVLRLDTQVQKEEEISKQLKASIEGLHNDPKALERLARERLGYAKPGEVVVRFEGTNSLATP